MQLHSKWVVGKHKCATILGLGEVCTMNDTNMVASSDLHATRESNITLLKINIICTLWLLGKCITWLRKVRYKMQKKTVASSDCILKVVSNTNVYNVELELFYFTVTVSELVLIRHRCLITPNFCCDWVSVHNKEMLIW